MSLPPTVLWPGILLCQVFVGTVKCVKCSAPAVQVSNNVINTLSQGILLGWGNYALDLPYVYGNNINNSFTNNQITGSQISPLTLTSALTASVVNLAMTDVMCGVFGDNTRQFGWETQNTPFNLAYVYGITFSGNSLTTTANCQRNLVNYAVRPSHAVMMVGICISKLP